MRAFWGHTMNQRIPTVACLISFETLARRKNLRLASDELKVHQSTIFYRIQKLQATLGVKLFQPDGYVLTEEGSAYLEQVRYVLCCFSRFPAAPAHPELNQLT